MGEYDRNACRECGMKCVELADWLSLFDRDMCTECAKSLEAAMAELEAEESREVAF